MTVSSHTSKKGITGGYNTGSIDITDTDAVQAQVITITLANGDVLTATETTVATTTDTDTMTFVAATGSSGSKRTAAAASLAGALNANSKLTATSDSSVVTITEVFGGAGGSIATGAGMSEVDWSGGVDFTVGHDKHTVTAGGTVGGFNIKGNIKNNIDLALGGKAIGSKVIAKTGTIGIAGVEKAHATGGTLAYNPLSRSVTLSSSNTGWLIRGGSSTLISGIAATDNVLAIAGSDGFGARNGGNIHEKTTYRQKGTWADQVFDLIGGVLLQADGTDKADISGRGDSALLAKDGAVTGKTIPGEFVILSNFVDYTTDSSSGGTADSTNLKNYSDITG